MRDKEAAIAVKEHDSVFNVKKVSSFKSDGNGNLVREAITGMNIGMYDYIELGYTADNVTSITYKTGGASGTVLATLSLTYNGSDNLTSVTRA